MSKYYAGLVFYGVRAFYLSFKLGVVLFVWVGCGQSQPNRTGGGGSSGALSCALPADQSGTLSGQWPVTPIPIAVMSGDFSSGEIDAISRAAVSWNNFYVSLKGFPLFDLGGGNTVMSLNQPKPNSSQFCSTNLVSGGGFHGRVMIYKGSQWQYDSQIIALTSYCSASSRPLNRISMAVIEVNFFNFFSPGTGSYPDLESILLHELGHLMGIDHSCFLGTRAGYPNCFSGTLPAGYQAAVMYPVISFVGSNGVVQRALQSNDELRASCIYGN